MAQQVWECTHMSEVSSVKTKTMELKSMGSSGPKSLFRLTRKQYWAKKEKDSPEIIKLCDRANPRP